jgi:hypothetical protein
MHTNRPSTKMPSLKQQQQQQQEETQQQQQQQEEECNTLFS